VPTLIDQPNECSPALGANGGKSQARGRKRKSSVTVRAIQNLDECEN
jgi:hypothetical protein